MNTGLTDKEFENISDKIKRRVPLNGALRGKVMKVATPEQYAELNILYKQAGGANEFVPDYNLKYKMGPNKAI